MIFDSVLWFVSTSVETCRLLMKDERKRMKAFGGRGMWSSAFFFPCPGLRGAVPSRFEGKREDVVSVLSTKDSSVNVPGVTAGAKAICCEAVADSIVSVQGSRSLSRHVHRSISREGKVSRKRDIRDVLFRGVRNTHAQEAHSSAERALYHR